MNSILCFAFKYKNHEIVMIKQRRRELPDVSAYDVASDSMEEETKL